MIQRKRRLRAIAAMREATRETDLRLSQLVMPVFVYEEEAYSDADEPKSEKLLSKSAGEATSSGKRPIPSMPGIFMYDLNSLEEYVDNLYSKGIQLILLFGKPHVKSKDGSGAWAENGIVQRAIRRIKDVCPEMTVIADVCLCGYTEHGHCGMLADKKFQRASYQKNRSLRNLLADIEQDDLDTDLFLESGNSETYQDEDLRADFDSENEDEFEQFLEYPVNDPSCMLLAKISVSLALAGADAIAPSAMMDGQVKAIREALDSANFPNLPIISYSSKFSSAFYAPFRNALECYPGFGGRDSYQIDPANGKEALEESLIDEREGADMLMVKPASHYLDVIREIKRHSNLPLAAYQVSGEYSLLKCSSKIGWLDEKKCVLEVLTSIKRAGADLIITYFAEQYADWENEACLSPDGTRLRDK